MASSNTEQQIDILSDVVLIRLLLIVLLVMYHAFAPYCGGWEPLPGQETILAYWWIGRAAYSFMLPSFVFISGYVFGFQVRRKGERVLNFKNIIVAKIKRLILPCVIFSLLYILMFADHAQLSVRSIYQILNGVGHMWFLPMLFWCFVGVYIIEKLKLSNKLVIPLLILASIFLSIWPFPLRIGKALYYLQFFMLGI